MSDWTEWHKAYGREGSSLSRRLAFVQDQIAQALDQRPAGPVRVLSVCAGDGRDLLEVIERHPRGKDVRGRLVELDPTLVERARRRAPESIEVVRGDAGSASSYEAVPPADLLLCCGVFGHLDDSDIRTTIQAWRVLAAPGARVLWTRGDSPPDLREDIRQWVAAAGFRERAFAGPPDSWSVGVAEWPGPTEPFGPDDRYFTFGSRRRAGASGSSRS